MKNKRINNNVTNVEGKRKDPLESLWLFGIHPCLAAIKNPKRELKKLYLTRYAYENIAHHLIGLQLKPKIVPRKMIENILSPDAMHQGIALQTTPLKSMNIETFLQENKLIEELTVVALDQVNDPRNIGAIIRTAAAFNVDAILVPNKGTPRETGLMVKAAAGAYELLPTIRASNLARAMKQMQKNEFWVIGLSHSGIEPISDLTFPKRSLLVFGSEGEGLRTLTNTYCDFSSYIGLSKQVNSLNIGNAAAIVLFERFKQLNRL